MPVEVEVEGSGLLGRGKGKEKKRITRCQEMYAYVGEKGGEKDVKKCVR